MTILKASGTDIFHMNAELDRGRKRSEQHSEQENPDSQPKAIVYALLNRPSPPF
jgi:hypothetical protein